MREYPYPVPILIPGDLVPSLLAEIVPRFVDTYVVVSKEDSLTYECLRQGSRVQVDATFYRGNGCSVIVWVEANDQAIEHGIALEKALVGGGGRLIEGDEFFPGLIAPPLTLRAYLVTAVMIAILVLLVSSLLP